MKSKKTAKPKRDALRTGESQPIAAGSPSPAAIKEPAFSEATESAFSKWMTQVSGTEDRNLQSKMLDQAVGAVPDFTGQEMKSFDYVAAAIRGIGPKDTLEGMLAVQMVAAYTMASECLRRAALPNLARSA